MKARKPSGLPFVAILEPRDRYRLDNLPPELTATLGPTIQRVAKAIQDLDAVARPRGTLRVGRILSRFG